MDEKQIAGLFDSGRPRSTPPASTRAAEAATAFDGTYVYALTRAESERLEQLFGPEAAAAGFPGDASVVQKFNGGRWQQYYLVDGKPYAVGGALEGDGGTATTDGDVLTLVNGAGAVEYRWSRAQDVLSLELLTDVGDPMVRLRHGARLHQGGGLTPFTVGDAGAFPERQAHVGAPPRSSPTRPLPSLRTMGKKSRDRNRTSQAVAGEAGADPAVGPRQPCPCGSGRRYKACHGSSAGAPPAYSARPFGGLTSEADIVAMREFVPAATAPLRLRDSDREVLLCSLLPGAAPALVRADGTIWLGLQVQHAYGDPSRDLAAVLTAALEAEPGTAVGLRTDPGEGPRLQDLVVDEPLEVAVHDGFDFWIADLDDSDGQMAAALGAANDSAAPTARLQGVDGAYWTAAGEREYLRWVQDADEDRVLDGLARMHVASTDTLIEGDRLIGMFRVHGVVVPVWDLPRGTGPENLAQAAPAMATTLTEAIADTAPLTTEERSARAGLAGRQVTIR